MGAADEVGLVHLRKVVFFVDTGALVSTRFEVLAVAVGAGTTAALHQLYLYLWGILYIIGRVWHTHYISRCFCFIFTNCRP